MLRVISRASLLCLFMTATSSISPAQPAQPSAQQNSQPSQRRDGQHDFDFNLGNWKTHIRYLTNPATGPTWVEFDGIVVVRKVWHGRAQIEEIEADGSAGHFEGLTLFLYNSESQSGAKISQAAATAP